MRKLNIVVFLLFAFVTLNISAQKKFPQLSGETVTDKKLTLPNDTKGKFTLVGLAYSKKAEDDLNTWFQPVYDRFVADAGGGLFSDFMYDINVYFVPMFTGVNAASIGTAKNQAKKNLDPELHPHVLFYKGSIKEYEDTLNLKSKNKPYVFVLDKSGKIIYETSGPCTSAKLSEIENIVSED
ncbi:hypothetical protein [Marinigracilibium pacificum]|uniref:ATP10 protein n=1 Tax=Marinigracilibium pacificum TaxID=2729599 RepID=A0A848IXM1_9BACT|nr:hypothetical protein [Marinigracilibium pacificum]NMM47020.1 hypothetical protein [Marinigracilibium pacificum]